MSCPRSSPVSPARKDPARWDLFWQNAATEDEPCGGDRGHVVAGGRFGQRDHHTDGADEQADAYAQQSPPAGDGVATPEGAGDDERFRGVLALEDEPTLTAGEFSSEERPPLL